MIDVFVVSIISLKSIHLTDIYIYIYIVCTIRLYSIQIFINCINFVVV
jgi:hypothetical protein